MLRQIGEIGGSSMDDDNYNYESLLNDCRESCCL